MTPDLKTRRSRRAILASALGVAGATAIDAVAGPLPVRAAGDDGFAITIGRVYLDIQSETILSNQANNASLLSATSSSAAGFGGGTALIGKSNTGFGVVGSADNETGVAGRSASAAGIGVTGSNTDGTGIGGGSDSGNGVVGASNSGTGVVGSSNSGTGVSCTSSGGTALSVSGPAHFSRSGRVSVPAGKSSVDVAVGGGLAATSNVLATLQQYRAGVSVAAVRVNYPIAGTARIYLTKVASAKSSTPVAWFVLD